MNKQIITADDLLQPKLSGVTKLAAIVKRTLGPGGLPIIIERQGQALDGSPLGPKITKDGVSVAEQCYSSDPIEDVVIQAVKAICRKTNVDAGDGTTTAIVLGEAILNATQDALARNPKLNPQLVKEAVEVTARLVIQQLRDSAIKVTDPRVIEEVATISANGDRTIGEVIRKAFDHVGAEGVVTVDEGSGLGVTLGIVDGYRFNKGTKVEFFNNSDRTRFEAEDAAVVLYDGKILNFTDLIPILEQIVTDENGQPSKKMPPVVIIANEFSRDVVQFLLIQRAERGMQFCIVEGPHMTHVRTGYYDDLAYYTGGTRLGNGARSLAAATAEDVGLVKKIIIDKYKTTLYDGQGDESDILTRVDQLKAQKLHAESPYDAQVLNDRIAALTSGIAKIGVGGATELEMKEKYDRIEDALNASRAAIEEGVVPGGGVTLLRIADSLRDKQDIGSQILWQALSAPFFQILENIGIYEQEATPIADALLAVPGKVFDARNRVQADAMEAGIVDPVKVTRTALENAVSIAGLLSTAGGAIIFQRDKQP